MLMCSTAFTSIIIKDLNLMLLFLFPSSFGMCYGINQIVHLPSVLHIRLLMFALLLLQPLPEKLDFFT